MKTAKSKQDELKLVDCKCVDQVKLKTGEIGLKLSIKRRAKVVQHYTARGKEKNALYFLMSLVKSYTNLFDIKDLDLVKVSYDESDSVSVSAKEEKDLSDAERSNRAMAEIQKVIDGEREKSIKEFNDGKS